MSTLLLTKEARIYNGEKTASSINSPQKTGQLHVKKIRTLPNSISSAQCSQSVDANQPSHPLSSPSPPAFSLSQHHGLFQ